MNYKNILSDNIHRPWDRVICFQYLYTFENNYSYHINKLKLFDWSKIKQQQRHAMHSDTFSTKLSASFHGTICPRSSCPFYIVTNYTKWATTNSWTYSNNKLL